MANVRFPPIADNKWFDVIIGRDVLTRYDFHVRTGGHWELRLQE